MSLHKGVDKLQLPRCNYKLSKLLWIIFHIAVCFSLFSFFIDLFFISYIPVLHPSPPFSSFHCFLLYFCSYIHLFYLTVLSHLSLALFLCANQVQEIRFSHFNNPFML